MHPDNRAGTAASWKQILQSGVLYEIEHRVRRHDGVYRTMQPRSVPIRSDDSIIQEWSGIDLIEQALACIPGTPVLMISGYAEHQNLARAQVLAIELRPKPFTPQALAQAVRAALDRHGRN